MSSLSPKQSDLVLTSAELVQAWTTGRNIIQAFVPARLHSSYVLLLMIHHHSNTMITAMVFIFLKYQFPYVFSHYNWNQKFKSVIKATQSSIWPTCQRSGSWNLWLTVLNIQHFLKTTGATSAPLVEAKEVPAEAPGSEEWQRTQIKCWSPGSHKGSALGHFLLPFHY